jgi:hypothetical protein
MAWTVTEFPHPSLRYLVCDADSEDELENLRARAESKGWTFYVDGTDPHRQRRSLWLTKPGQADAPTPK